MEWANLASIVQQQLSQQLALFVSRIAAQEAELAQLRQQVAKLEAKVEQQKEQLSASTSSATVVQQQPQPPTSRPVSVLHPPPPDASIPSSQARALSEMMADDPIPPPTTTTIRAAAAHEHDEDVRTHVPAAKKKRAASPTDTDEEHHQTKRVKQPTDRPAPHDGTTQSIEHTTAPLPVAVSTRKKPGQTSPAPSHAPSSTTASSSKPSSSSKCSEARKAVVDLSEEDDPMGVPAPAAAAAPAAIIEESVQPEQHSAAALDAYELFGGGGGDDGDEAMTDIPQQEQGERKEDPNSVRSPAATSTTAPSAAAAKPSAMSLLQSAFPQSAIAAAAVAVADHSFLTPPLASSQPVVPPQVQVNADALANEGIACASKGDWLGSRQKLNQAIEMVAVHGWSLVSLNWLKQRSTVHAKLGENKEAHADAARMILHHPHKWTGYYILSTLLGRDKDYAQALLECKRAWHRVPKRSKHSLPPGTTTPASAKQEKQEKENEADRKKVMERIRQLEQRLHMPPCELKEDEEDEVSEVAPAAAPTITEAPPNGRAISPAPHHSAVPAVSPASTRAPTVPSSPHQPVNASGGGAKRALDYSTPLSGKPKSLEQRITPLICLGLYKVSATACPTVVSTALRMGFRRLDTAGSYLNEEQVGRALTLSGVPRKEVYLTTKISWNDMASEEQAYKAACESLKKLDVKYLDCLMLHFPARNKIAANSPLHADGRIAAWRAAERLVEEGRVRALGVANFEKAHLTHLLAHAKKVKPRVNQIEIHPLLYQTQLQLIDFCREKHIELEAYSALAMGKKELLENPILAAIGKTHHRSVTDVVLQWSLQHGFIPLAKSVNPLHMQSNLNVVNKPFTLTDEQMHDIDQLEKTHGKLRCAWDPRKYP